MRRKCEQRENHSKQSSNIVCLEPRRCEQKAVHGLWSLRFYDIFLSFFRFFAMKNFLRMKMSRKMFHNIKQFFQCVLQFFINKHEKLSTLTFTYAYALMEKGYEKSQQKYFGIHACHVMKMINISK